MDAIDVANRRCAMALSSRNQASTSIIIKSAFRTRSAAAARCFHPFAESLDACESAATINLSSGSASRPGLSHTCSWS